MHTTFFAPDYGPKNSVNLIGGSLGAYATVNRQLNSDAKLSDKNQDTWTYGGLSELGFDHILGGEQWYRTKVGVVTDNIKDKSDFADSLEWIPVYPDELIHFPSKIGPVGFRFDPEVKIQYDHALDPAETLAFSNRPQSLRIGPQLSLWLQPFADIDYLAALNVNLTYHPSYEVFSGRHLSWFQIASTYNLDPNGVLGLTVGYQRGSDEDTGKDTNLFKVSLTSKLDYCSGGGCPPQAPTGN